MANPLTDVLPDRARRIGYAAMFVTWLGLGGVTAGYAVLEGGVPDWLLFTNAAYGFIAGPGFAVAGSNVGK